MNSHRYCIQCRDTRSGKTGDFFCEKNADGTFRAVSPIFDHLGEFYAWAHANGYRSANQTTSDLTMIRDTA